MNAETKMDPNQKPAKWALIVATWFGLGYSPTAPGTAGTVGAVLLYLLLSGLHPIPYLAVWLALFALACTVAQKVQDGIGKADPQIVVIDEVLGYLIAMFMLPASAGYIIAAFFLFRTLDIIKPFPASYFDREVDNGFGIVMDDVVAGIYANLLLQLFRLVFG